MIKLTIVLSIIAFMLVPARSFELDDTNTSDIQRWFRYLTNHLGGSCCGEGDGYPARIDHMATAADDRGAVIDDGRACIVDTQGKEIVVGGTVIKKKREIKGDPCVTFNWNKVTKEKHGNPFDYAFVFVRLNEDGTINNVYCVVPLPQYY